MGQPLTAPVFGANCGNCTPGTWAIGETPKKMIAFFTGITKCPGAPAGNPPEGSYIIEQEALQPCVWKDASTDLVVTMAFFLSSTIFASPGGTWYSEAAGPVCSGSGNNDAGACGPAGIDGALGNHIISMEPLEDIPWLLTDDYNIVPTDETWFNQWLLDTPFPPDKVVGLYNTKYRANVLVKYES